ncbi:MAG: glycoside hydrolase family 172 protein [Verrucomicrobiota bacterium]
MTFSRRLFLAGLLLASARPGLLAQTPTWEELSRLDRLPAFKASVKLGSVSSYDRSGGNDDGFSGKYSFVRQDPEGLVLADLAGPGVIYRLWTPTPSDDDLEFFFDGETSPRLTVKYRHLFLGHEPGFPHPLVGFGVGGYFCYGPIPFAERCVVRMRAKKVQFYQINYALFAPSTRIESYSRRWVEETATGRARAIDVLQRSGDDLSSVVAPPGTQVELTRRAITLPPHSSQVLFRTDSGGRIVGLRLTPASVMAGKARDLLLRISFDDDQPAVLCPLGDFFGYAWGQPAMRSLLVGTTGETNYCYFPMPFDRRAAVEIVSERASPVELRAEVMHTSVPRAAAEGKFYAVWRRENPTAAGQPYTFLQTEGRGHLVGVVLQAQGFESGKTLFFEGDDETTIDGETVVRGTGSEDFFNGGWYDVPDRWEKQLSFPLSGCLGYSKHLGRTGGYRLFLGDAYAFRQSIRQTIEHAGEKNSIPTDYCSVSYLYSAQPPTGDRPLPSLAQRGVTDLAEVLFPAWWQLPISAWSFEKASLTRRKQKIGNEEVRFLALAAEGTDWFGPHFLEPSCDLPASGRYGIFIEAVKGPAQAKVQLFQNENPVGEAVDLYAAVAEKSGRLLLGHLFLSEGKNNLMFKLVGKNENATGLGLDLISVICVRD